MPYPSGHWMYSLSASNDHDKTNVYCTIHKISAFNRILYKKKIFCIFNFQCVLDHKEKSLAINTTNNWNIEYCFSNSYKHEKLHCKGKSYWLSWADTKIVRYRQTDTDPAPGMILKLLITPPKEIMQKSKIFLLTNLFNFSPFVIRQIIKIYLNSKFK